MNREIRQFPTDHAWLLALLALVGFIAVTATSLGSWLPVAGLVGVGVLWLLSGTRALSTTDRDTASDDGSAVETLKQQYSTGEIDESEFERRLERLLETDDDLHGASDPVATQSARTEQADETTRRRDESDKRDRERGSSPPAPPRRRPSDRSRCNQRGKRPRGRRR